jgi:uncharacterized damage-inducible protein DinB
MGKSLLADAFGHHVWATLKLIDVCQSLDAEQTEAAAPGTYGTIVETLRHLVGADASYLFVISGGRWSPVDTDTMTIPELRAVMERDGDGWEAVVTEDLDPTKVLVRHRDDGTDSNAPLGIRIGQVLHHGTDHRSQICTTLTTLGVEPPNIDVWDFGAEDGRVFETATSG